MNTETNQSLKIISLMDITLLDEEATQKDLENFCADIKKSPTRPASICVYPKWIAFVKDYFKAKPMPVATVLNFPEAKDSLDTVVKQIKEVIELGADELDIVLPYHNFNPNQTEPALEWLTTIRQACPDHVLKIIIESGEAPSLEWVEKATACVIKSGADFVKTSTGKTSQGATLDAVRIMCHTLKEGDRPCGLKISGGVRTIETAEQYMHLASTILSPSFLTEEWFRIGASKLYLACLEQFNK